MKNWSFCRQSSSATHVTNVVFAHLQSTLSVLPSLSKKGRSMLYTHQYKYTHLLFKYCEDNYQLSASSRQVDLILLYDIVGKNFEDFQYELYLFPYSPPQFQSKKLTENTIQVDDNMNDANIASFMLNSPDY